MNPLVARLRTLHDRAKAGTLAPEDRAEYVEKRAELGRMLLIAQSVGKAGRTLRTSLRMATVMKVELDFGGAAPVRTSTIDVAEKGFAALLPNAQTVGRILMFALHVPDFGGGGTRPFTGLARIASSRPHGATLHRVTFTFENVEEDDLERLQMVIIDGVLARFEAR